MQGRQSVKITYAHKRRRSKANKKLLSSPLEVLAPEIDDITQTQMARRMLKRSRRVALAEHAEDPNAEQIRQHLAKRMKRTQERVPDLGPSPDDTTFQTPFPSAKEVQNSVAGHQLVPEQFSPVPVAKRVLSRTSSRNLKENNPDSSQILASPFNSRPGSAASSPKRNSRGRAPHRVSHRSKSRTLSVVLKENVRHASRKSSAASLKDAGKEHSARRIKHQRYPSSPSTSYMRSQFVPEGWIVPPNTLSCTINRTPSPARSVHSDASFYIEGPQSCSTPALSRLRTNPRGRLTQNIKFSAFSENKGPPEVDDQDVEMTDATEPQRRHTIHLSKNSIFSSSDEFTVGSLPATNGGATRADRSSVISRDEPPTFVAGPPLTRGKAVDRSQTGTGSFVAEYNVPLPDPPHSPASSMGTKVLGPKGILKESIGERLFNLPGTSPGHGGNIFPCRNYDQLTPPASPARTTNSCPPSSPAQDLALEFQSMGIRGNPSGLSDGEVRHPLKYTVKLAEPAGKSTKCRFARNRAGTIRAIDIAKPGAPSSGVPVSSLSNVRRTRSGTVVGPDSKLATKDAGTSSRSGRGASTRTLVPISSGSESESDDELLLRSAWVEDLEYLGIPAPRNDDVEVDEMNLGGAWHGLEFGPPRRLGLRRR